MLSISLPALHLEWLQPAGDSDGPHQEWATQQQGSSSNTEEIVLMKPEHICCLSAGIFPAHATVHPSPLSRLHIPGSRAWTEEEAAQQGHLTEQHLRWVSNSTPEHSLLGRSGAHSYSLSTPRDPPSLSNCGQIRPWICVDPSD